MLFFLLSTCGFADRSDMRVVWCEVGLDVKLFAACFLKGVQQPVVLLT